MSRALVFLVCLVVGTAMAQPGYIRLQGDQFIDENGAPFFPMVMNYFIDFFYPANAPPSLDPSAAELAPCGYGRSSFFGAIGQCAYPSIAAGPASILQDLHEMKAMGFNTIRYLSRVRKKEGDGHQLSIKAFPSGQNELFLNLDPPYDPQANLVFEFQMNTVLHVCSLANTLGMKVLFEIGGDVHALDLNADWPEIQDHLDYIEAIAAFIEAHDVSNLLAYEFYGEPTFADGRPEVLPKHTRAQICEIAHAWNQRVKQVDPGHLTTIGGVFMDDLFQEGWDPVLLDVDFATMHLYLLHNRFEQDSDPTTFLDKATKRYADMLYEYDKLIRKPYIITETGFQGQDNPNGYPSYVYPYLLGSEQDQDDFLRATFPLVLGSRCAGYGWWVFQNVHWYADPPPWPPIPNDPISPQDYSERYYGIHNSGDPGPMDLANGITGYEGLRKQAAETFVSWVTNPPAPSVQYGPLSASADMNDTYYNPYAHPENLGVEWMEPNGYVHPSMLRGRVVDQLGAPIAGALVKGDAYVGVDPLNAGELLYYVHFTYTDENSEFEIRGFDPTPGNPASGDPFDQAQLQDRTISSLKIGTYATAYAYRGYDFEQGEFFEFVMDDEYELNSLQSEVDVVIDDEYIAQSEIGNYQALASITALAVTVAGSSEMKARYEVNWKPGFSANAGSEVHAFTTPLHFECAHILAAELKRAPSAISQPQVTLSTASAREIDLNMHRDRSQRNVHVFPNPGSLFRIDVDAEPAGMTDVMLLELRASTGELLISRAINATSTILDLSEFAPAEYTLIVHATGQRYSRKLLRQ